MQPEFFPYEEYKRRRPIPPWRAHLRKLLVFPARFALGWKFRRRCLRGMGVRMGDSYAGRDCLFDEEAPELIRIGDGVTISSRVIIATHDVWRNVGAEVWVEDKAFVGIGAILLPGVVIGKRSVVAAGAVVTKPVEPGVIVGGSPAKVIRRLTDEEASR
jgi:acetyltransferase-like isoleucine patch superfamily enzyme